MHVTQRAVRAIVATSATVALGLSLAACTGDTGADAESGTDLVEFSLASIPGGPVGLAVNMAMEEGGFEEAGLDLSLEILESGPAVINGVIANQFDAGWTAIPPILLAVDGDADLRLITGGIVYVEPGPTSVVARGDIGITGWADLAGKKVGTNAPRSGGSLAILASVAKAGGDPDSVELIPLPFDQVASSVANGDIDAGAISAPFNYEALANNAELIDLGDPFWVAYDGALNDMFYTTNASYDANPEKYEKFVGVLDDYFARINAMPLEEYRSAMGEFFSMPEELSALLPPTELSVGPVTDVDVAPYNEVLELVGWTDGPIDLSDFLGGN